MGIKIMQARLYVEVDIRVNQVRINKTSVDVNVIYIRWTSGWDYNFYVDIRNEMATLYRGPSIDVSCHVCYRIGATCVMGGMCNLYRGPSIDISCQDSVHLTKRF